MTMFRRGVSLRIKRTCALASLALALTLLLPVSAAWSKADGGGNRPATATNLPRDEEAHLAKMRRDPRYLRIIEDQSAREKRELAARDRNGGWGGGNSVTRSPGERPVLLDLFTADPAFRDTRFSHRPLADTDFMRYSGFEDIGVKELDAYAGARRLLEGWRPYAQGLIDIVLLALDNLNVYYVWRDVALADAETYYLPADLRRRFPMGRLTPVVVYHHGLKISGPRWNAMGDLSREALLVHEALRRVQLTYGLTVSSEKLQALTAVIALKAPSNDIDIETTEYLDRKLLDEIRYVSGWKIGPAEVRAGICAMEASIGPIESLVAARAAEEPEGFATLYDNPADFISGMCEPVRNRPPRTCTVKPPPSAETAIQLWLELFGDAIRYAEIRSLDHSTTASIARIALPGMLRAHLTGKDILRDWRSLQAANCTAGGAVFAENELVAALKILLYLLPPSTHSGPEKETLDRLITMARDAFVSLHQTERVSLPARIEEKLIEQAQTERSLHLSGADNLWPNIIRAHLRGEVKNPEGLRIVRGFRLVEEGLRQRLSDESLPFQK
jgi:hypothetical protein